MNGLLIITCFTLFVLSEARPRESLVDPEIPLNIGGHVRVRRGFDYEEFMDNFWENLNKHSNNNILAIGNGYKNKNTVHISGQRREGNNLVSIGNGAKNTNTVYIGVKPESLNGDPFNNAFFND